MINNEWAKLGITHKLVHFELDRVNAALTIEHRKGNRVVEKVLANATENDFH